MGMHSASARAAERAEEPTAALGLEQAVLRTAGTRISAPGVDEIGAEGALPMPDWAPWTPGGRTQTRTHDRW